MDSLGTNFPLLQSAWDNYPKLLTLSAISGLAFAVFALIKITNYPIVFTISLNPIALFVGISVIASLAYLIFFKNKFEEKQKSPEWLKDNFYELESLVKTEKALSGPPWMQYSYHKLQSRMLNSESVVFNDLTKAADEGHAEAKFKLSLCYEEGIGVMRDLNKAFELLKEVKNSQNKDVLVKLGLYYYHLRDDQNQAVELWEKAAEGSQGHPYAKTLLANHYTKKFPSDPTKDLAKKIIAYHKEAADHPSGIGSESALYLDTCYANWALNVSVVYLRKQLYEMIGNREKIKASVPININSIILIWAENLPEKDDGRSNLDQLKSEMKEAYQKYTNYDMLFKSQREAFLKRK